MRHQWPALLLCVAACGRDDTSSAAREDSGIVTPVTAARPDTPRDSNAFAGAMDRVSGTGHAHGVAVLSSVRTASHDDFDRIVFEFRGGALPDYVVEYTTQPPTQCGSGATMTVEGARRLTVRFSPAQAHAPVDGEERSTIPDRAMNPALPTLRAVALSCDFEGVLEWVLGLDARRAFHVTVLDAPARLVIDLARR